MDRIAFDEFAKLDIRIGKILSASTVQGTERLIHMSVDIGEPEPRSIVAGMRQYYEPEEMTGKSVVVLTNLQPRNIRGILSDGMILAASTEGFQTVKLLTVDGDMPVGSKIS
ncbi:hypothetical protein JW979_04660 [bacterium]|nr:hypothetical protein [candidate division CSSED10-310 bacterium]